jgi:hypothetical protein
MYRQYNGNKYHAHSTEYAGIVYHSKLEAAYAQELDLRVKAKDIKDWERQVKLPLKVREDGRVIANYYIDFVIHHNDGSKEYVECKGFETALWKMKWAILEERFELDFMEHEDDRLTVIKQSSWGRR